MLYTSLPQPTIDEYFTLHVVLVVFTRPGRTALPGHIDYRLFQVLGDGSTLGTFESSGNTLGFENWTLNANDVSTITLVASDLGYNDWLSITEASYPPVLLLTLCPRRDVDWPYY